MARQQGPPNAAFHHRDLAPSNQDPLPNLAARQLQDLRKDRDQVPLQHHQVTWGQIKTLASQATNLLQKQNVPLTAENHLMATFDCLTTNSTRVHDNNYSQSQ